MNKDIRFFTNQYSDNLTFHFIVGAAFGFGWTPCIGPILGSIITLAALEETIGKGILLLSFYSLGLAIPFIISGILIDKFLFFSKNFKKYISIITKVGGAYFIINWNSYFNWSITSFGIFYIRIFSLPLEELDSLYINLPTASFIFLFLQLLKFELILF